MAHNFILTEKWCQTLNLILFDNWKPDCSLPKMNSSGQYAWNWLAPRWVRGHRRGPGHLSINLQVTKRASGAPVGTDYRGEVDLKDLTETQSVFDGNCDSVTVIQMLKGQAWLLKCIIVQHGLFFALCSPQNARSLVRWSCSWHAESSAGSFLSQAVFMGTQLGEHRLVCTNTGWFT